MPNDCKWSIASNNCYTAYKEKDTVSVDSRYFGWSRQINKIKIKIAMEFMNLKHYLNICPKKIRVDAFYKC